MWHKLFPLVYERYLAKQIYLSFVCVLFALISLFIFFDFITEIGDTTNTYTVLLAFITVILRVPSRLVEIMPIAGLIAGIYVMANMAAQSEYTILRIAGLDAGVEVADLGDGTASENADAKGSIVLFDGHYDAATPG